MSVKKFMYIEKIMFGILVYVFVKMNDATIICYEVIKSYQEEV